MLTGIEMIIDPHFYNSLLNFTDCFVLLCKWSFLAKVKQKNPLAIFFESFFRT